MAIFLPQLCELVISVFYLLISRGTRNGWNFSSFVGERHARNEDPKNENTI